MNKTFIITGILMAAALTGIFSTTTMAAFADETEINQKNKLNGAASGEGDVHNCADNYFDSEHFIIDSNAPNCSDVSC